MKKRITIPKGTKCVDGTECNQNLELEIDIPETIPSVTTIPTAGVSNIPNPSQPQQTILLQPPAQTIAPAAEPPKPTEEDKHKLMKDLMPSGVNFAKCQGTDCGHKKIKNNTQTQKFKACPGCKNNNIPRNNDFCPTCGLDEEHKDFDEWDDSDIEMKENEEQED